MKENDQKSSFKPFVPADKVLPEITPISVILGFGLIRCLWCCQCLPRLTCRYDSVCLHSGSRFIDGYYPSYFET